MAVDMRHLRPAAPDSSQARASRGPVRSPPILCPSRANTPVASRGTAGPCAHEATWA